MTFISKHQFTFNPEDNGGEAVTLETKFVDNGDGFPDGILTEQTLTLMSYGNSASISLCAASFNSKNLRELANGLDAARIQAENIVKGRSDVGKPKLQSKT